MSKIIQNTKTLIFTINEKIKEIDLQNDDIILKSKYTVKFLVEQLNILKKSVRSYSFLNKRDEIYFFKHLKPSISSKLIFYSNVFKIESRKPKGTDKSIRKHYDKELYKIEIFSNNNLEFTDYMRHNSTYSDEKYFIQRILRSSASVVG